MLTLDFNQHKFHNHNDLRRKIFSNILNNIDGIKKAREINFDFSKCIFDFDIIFIELFDQNSLEYRTLYKEYDNFSLIKDVLHAIAVEDSNEKNQPVYDLIFIFNNAIFNGYPKFDFLRCSKLYFGNTIFKKGALFRHLEAKYVLYEPRLLDADVTFYHRKKADIEAGILRGDTLGKIEEFHYRHALEGNGSTFFIGVSFTKEAHFTDAVLDNVQFSHLDVSTLSKCYFANSMLEETKFYNCHFPYHKNAWTIFDKDGWDKQPFFIFLLSGLLLCVLFLYAPFLAIAGAAVLNAFVFMPLMSLISKISFLNVNKHMAIADDIKLSNSQQSFNAEDNYHVIREIYRQLRVNFEKHGDYQTAGEFYYSQRYTELLTFGSRFYPSFWQWNLLGIHHIVNGFGERWVRAFVWFFSTWIVFAFLLQPNIDFTSSKSTPEYFLNAYHDNIDKNLTYNLNFDENSITSDLNRSMHFMLIAKTTFEDTGSFYICKSPQIIEEKNVTKKVFAFDNRFDYHYTEQYIPMLREDPSIYFAYSFTKMISPFVSEEKNWFTTRSKDAHILGIFESILLWFFFGAFVLAVKNKIKR
ncbi:MAG: hypothetical protein PHW18_12340 [Sulfuricurvum sp.]|uniref:hypothetical protein n=1 Tax=Sulfuricurvum sp. TaxID=2025608 RepID=UPI00263174C7|nr:hypothetical protein [Sulfuricurvum sp.]MDD2830355.1 hypothetical protein [Sulfuricurvum sp.]MDD4950682.1 hypothetical protein [Sulfuricurvum sp.]